MTIKEEERIEESEDKNQHSTAMQNDVLPSQDDQISKYSTFIRSVCMSLLPSESLFDRLPIDRWLTLIRRMIPFASIIPNESGELAAIKLCHDIAEVFMSSDCTILKYITEIGSLLRENNCRIDQTELCEYLFQVSKQLQKTTNVTASSLQKLFCSYIVRCIVTNPENDEQLKFILSKIRSKEIFIPKLTFFGQVLKVAIMIDLAYENDDTFNPYIDILSKGLEDDTVSFAQCFDEFLRSIADRNTEQLPILTLMTDIIEENAIELDLEIMQSIDTASDSVLVNLSNCREKIENGQLSLDLICAIAMTRKFLKLYIEMFFSEGIKQTNIPILSNHVNALLSMNVEKEDTVSEFHAQSLHFLLKTVENVKGQEKINLSCEQLRPYLPALKSVSWSQNVVETCHIFNPLCMYVNKTDYQYCFNQIMTYDKEGNKLKTIVDAGDKTLPLFSVIAQRLYMQRCLAERNDTDMELAKAIKKLFKNTLTRHQSKLVLPILDGGFKLNIFVLSTVVEAPTHHMVSVIIHMAGLMFFMTPKGTCKESLWKRYVLAPDASQTDFFPLIKFESFLKCKPWPECLSNYSSAVVCVLQIFAFSCNIMSLEFDLGYQDTTEKGETLDFLGMQLLSYWNYLRETVQLKFNDICLLIHIILNKSQMLFSPDASYTETLSNIKIIEQADIINNAVRNRFELINIEMKKFAHIDKGSCESCVLDIEPCTIGENCHLFRIPASKNLEILRFELNARENNESLKLLEFILGNIELLSLPKFVFSFVNWHLAVFSHGSYKHRQVDFKQLLLRKFIADEPEEKRRTALTKSFEMFSENWNEIRKVKLGGCEELKGCLMENMNKSVTMGECTILNEQSVMKIILDILIAIQNSTLDKAQSSLQHGAALEFFGEQSHVSLLDVKKRDLITFEWDDNWLRYSQPDTDYGKAKSIQFDFERIEKEIQAEALVGKSKIDVPSLPTIMFTDDLHHNSVLLLNQIKLLVPQKYVPKDVRKAIEKQRDTDSSLLSSLLTHVGMTLSLLRKTQTKAEVTVRTQQNLPKQETTVQENSDLQITQYLDIWKSLTGMIPTVYKSIFPEDVRLCHVVDLYQLLEEMNGDLICESLGDNYKKELKKEEKDVLEKAKRSKMKYVEKLEHPLKVFVHRGLAFRTHALCPEQPLIDYISNSDLWWHDDFDDDNEKKRIVVDQEHMELNEILTPGLLVENIFEVVQFIKNAMEDERERKLTVSEIAANYRPSRTQKQGISRRKGKGRTFMKT